MREFLPASKSYAKGKEVSLMKLKTKVKAGRCIWE